MTTPKQFTSISAPDASRPPHAQAHTLRDEAVAAGAVAGDATRVLQFGAMAAIGLLVCPPLAVLVFVFVVPFLVVGLGVGLFVAILSTPYLLFHHFRARDKGHMSLLALRLRRAVRALGDLAPHRIVADVRKATGGR